MLVEHCSLSGLMELSKLSSDMSALKEQQVACSLLETAMVTFLLAAQKSLACLLILNEALPEKADGLPSLIEKRFPLEELHRREKSVPENKDTSDTEDDDEDEDDEAEDPDDAGDEDFSGGEEGGDDEDEDEGGPEEDPAANGNGGSDDDDEDDDEGEDDEDEEEEDGDEEEDQPPAKKKK